ncbi:hypothetical protein NM688_g5253 [Phlebia brevispora]|uniref:Uncharacterized protein n=1 Tax=Phlebia brevispora TaxID=194682 RepID=A0ACC1SY73_9APHY|nr:hypothetical protein NM688_g5253 [Phlebia brevispora]
MQFTDPRLSRCFILALLHLDYHHPSEGFSSHYFNQHPTTKFPSVCRRLPALTTLIHLLQLFDFALSPPPHFHAADDLNHLLSRPRVCAGKMPAKYSHVKKRPIGVQKRSANANGNNVTVPKDHRTPNIYADRSITKAVSAVTQLERAIAQILLIRFEQDIARLFSTHLYCIALLHLPTFVMRCITVGGPGWVAANADSDEIKDFFRAAIGMDLRQAGERVATKSVLWSYTALRHFASSNNISICRKRGLHSVHLLPHSSGVQAHLDTLRAMPSPAFAKPPHLGPLTEGIRALEDACQAKYGKASVGSSEWDPEWRLKVRVGYERVTQTLWRVAREFDVRGYGLVLRDKLTNKWCDCGCSTDHLSEVCEKTVREDEEENGVRSGKEREWDGRGSGIYGWGTDEEEDIWEVDLDFVTLEPEECDDTPIDTEMTIGELMEWRYLRAEREKEQGNVAFKKGDYTSAIDRYKLAHQIEPEMPHYQLNLAAAYLKIKKWMEAEKACDAALSQHRSVKGYWRRAQARRAQGRTEDAIKDLRAMLKLQPTNTEALAEMSALAPPEFILETPDSDQIRWRSGDQATSSSASGSSKRTQNAASSSRSPHGSLDFASPSDHPKKKNPQSLPFARTFMDDRKLKINSLPMTIDVPVDLPLPDPLPKGGKDKGKRPSMPPLSSIRTQPETFIYPSWERYVVKRITD